MTADTRQQLYDRIRESSMDEVILEEMIRHGFWSEGVAKDTLPADLIHRRGELQREIRELAAQANRYGNEEQAVREIMKARMAEARARRIDTKRRHAEARNARARDWHAKNTREITHLGETGSAALTRTESDAARLKAQGLPHFDDLAAVAEAMGIAIGELRFLAYDRRSSTVSHYRRFRIPKKTGGYRTLSAPMPRLKRAQYWLLDNVLAQVEPHPAAHGFRSGHSIVTNARPHVGKAVVVNLDLKDFFPSIECRRVKGLFAALGYAEAQAAVFALLATEAPRAEVELDGRRWHVAQGERVLPQGAPTSPAITNLLCRRLDRRLTGAARKFGFVYTRYADDLTFSAETEGEGQVKKLLWSVRRIVADEGFAVNEDKTRIMRRNDRQEVTGLTVNDRVGVSRAERRRFRAHLHRAEKDGPAVPSFRKGAARPSALGYANFLHMVHGETAMPLVRKARALFGAETPPPLDKRYDPDFRQRAAAGEAPRADWWQPAVKPLALEEVPAPPPLPQAAGQRPVSAVPRARQSSQRRAAPPSPSPATETAVPRRGSLARTIGKVLLSLALLPVMVVPGGVIVFGVLMYFLWWYGRR